MKQELLHTPEGVRDIYNDECERKLYLEKKLFSVLESYGYHPIETPSFEFFDVFGKEVGTTPSRELYKFFDKEVKLFEPYSTAAGGERHDAAAAGGCPGRQSEHRGPVRKGHH